MLKFQNYRHYKLPITMNPLEYGKLIYNNIDDNSFIRSLGNRKFTYKNGQLIEVNKIIVQLILISLILLIILINIDNTSILIASTNIIKLRKVKSNFN